MAKRRALSDTFAEVAESAAALTTQADAAGASVPHTRARLPVADILDRLGGDTRPLSADHVDQLVASIQVFGLIQPIVVDRHHRLLAGAHRLAALLTWRNQDPSAFQARYGEGVPVHIYDLDAAQDPERAIAVEISENEKRRDYTRPEAIAMARRLLDQGYSHRSSPGAPKQGERMLIPALAVIIGRSEKTIRRYLQEAATGDRSARVASTNVDIVQIRPRTLEDLRTVRGLPDLSAEDAQVLDAALAILARYSPGVQTAAS